MSDTSGHRYRLSLAGESGPHPNIAWAYLKPDELASIIGDLTGYKESFVIGLLRKLDMNVGEHTQSIASSQLEAGCMPMRFMIVRVA